MPLKPNTFRVSLPTMIMIANAFAMSILCVFLKPNTFKVSFPETIKIANVFTSPKHHTSITPTKTNSKAKLKNYVTRQTKFVDFIYRHECTFPAIYELLMHEYHDKTRFSK